MMRHYVATGGEINTHTHSRSRHDDFREDLERTVARYGPTERVVREVMYAHGRTDDRTLARWVVYSERYFEDRLRQEDACGQVADMVVRRKNLPGYG